MWASVYKKQKSQGRKIKRGKKANKFCTINKIWCSVFVTSNFPFFQIQISFHLISKCSDIQNARHLK